MNVRELKQLLQTLPDDLPVYIPGHPTEGFTGLFLKPCPEASGERELGMGDLDEEELKEMELLNQGIPMEKALVLAPCGYWEERDNTHELN